MSALPQSYLLYLPLLAELLLLFLFGSVLLLLLLHCLTVLQGGKDTLIDTDWQNEDVEEETSGEQSLTISEWKAICLARPMLSQI